MQSSCDPKAVICDFESLRQHELTIGYWQRNLEKISGTLSLQESGGVSQVSQRIGAWLQNTMI